MSRFYRRTDSFDATRSPGVNVASPVDVEDNSQTPNQSVEAIQEFFASGLHPAVKADDHTSSDKTRPPAFWDMHLDDLQILRQVERHENMTQQLADLTKQFLDKAERREDLSVPDALSELGPVPKAVKDEDGLVNYYSKVIGKNCSRIASLLLGGSQWKRPIVCWRRKSSQSQAIADGFLCLDAEAIKESPSLTPRIKDILLLVAKTIPELAVFEFKSLRFDTPEKWWDLLGLAGNGVFDWTRCNTDCKKGHFLGGYSQITCAPMGFDATSIFQYHPESTLCFQYPKYEAVVKKRCREAAEEPNPCQEHETHARHVFQQVYAEAVAVDSTFLVIRCGNREIIGLRNRKGQTLYISGVIDLTAVEPTYLQIHVGLYIASVLDAIQRTMQLQEAVRPPLTWNKDWNRSRSKVKGKVPTSEALIALAREMRQVVLHSPSLYTPMQAKGPQFVRMGTEPDNSGGPVMQIIGPTLAKSERTYQAILQVKGHKIGTNVYLKLARTPENQEELLHEYEVCQRLTSKNINGTPDVIGCFCYTETGSAENILILAMISLDGGMPITQDDRAIPDSFIPQLQAIHDAGYLHGGIHPKHLLVDGHKTTMISMGKTEPHTPKGAAKEMDALRSLLHQGRKRRCRHLFGNTELVVVVEHTSVHRNPARFFVSLMLHVPTFVGMLNDKSIERVWYDEHDGKSRFMIQLKQTQDPPEFVYSWFNHLPDKLRDVRCEVQDVGVDIASSYGISKTAREFSPEHLLTFTSSVASVSSAPISKS